MLVNSIKHARVLLLRTHRIARGWGCTAARTGKQPSSGLPGASLRLVSWSPADPSAVSWTASHLHRLWHNTVHSRSVPPFVAEENAGHCGATRTCRRECRLAVREANPHPGEIPASSGVGACSLFLRMTCWTPGPEGIRLAPVLLWRVGHARQLPCPELPRMTSHKRLQPFHRKGKVHMSQVQVRVTVPYDLSEWYALGRVGKYKLTCTTSASLLPLTAPSTPNLAKVTLPHS